MAYPDLPVQVKEKLATEEMRWRHRYWHLVKNPGFVNNPSNAPIVSALADINWTARLTGEPGSGLDFLFMHRMMIGNINQMLSIANDQNWPEVVGWSEIPSAANDPDWPEPQIANLDDLTQWPITVRDTIEAIEEARSQQALNRNLDIAAILRDPNFLSRNDITLDRYGELIETTVHNWMHMRFADVPPTNYEDLSTDNDWLGAPFSSHVGSYFWKLHGWIDDCITAWEDANTVVADFSTAWRPPMEAPPWDELNISQPEAVSLAKSASLAPLFGTLQPFLAPPQVMERSMDMLSR